LTRWTLNSDPHIDPSAPESCWALGQYKLDQTPTTPALPRGSAIIPPFTFALLANPCIMSISLASFILDLVQHFPYHSLISISLKKARCTKKMSFFSIENIFFNLLKNIFNFYFIALVPYRIEASHPHCVFVIKVSFVYLTINLLHIFILYKEMHSLV
jgi:hypothetical protein